MIIDPVTLMFSDLSEDDAADLRQVVEGIVEGGSIPHPRPAWMTQWTDIALSNNRFTASMELVALSTILPIRALLSLLRYQDGLVAHPSDQI